MILLNVFLAALISVSAFGAPISQECLEAFKTYEKEPSFPTPLESVDVSKFEHIVNMTPGNQCHRACSVYGRVANFKTSAQPIVGAPIDLSVAWIQMMGFYVDFHRLLATKVELTATLTKDSLVKTVSMYGILYETQFPSSPNVNTGRLVKELNNLFSLFRKNEIDRETADEEAKTYIAKAFSRDLFPNEAEINTAIAQSEDLAKKLNVTRLEDVVDSNLVGLLNGTKFDPQDKNRVVIIDLIKNQLQIGRPVMITYSHVDKSFDGSKAEYLSPNFEGIGEVSETHLANIVGVKYEGGVISHLLIANTHDNAPLLVMPMDYFWWHTRSVSYSRLPN